MPASHIREGFPVFWSAMEGNAILWKLWKFTSGFLVLPILVATVGYYYWIATVVPFGGFKLTATVSDVSGENHAAVFEFEDGDSSETVMAVWLLEGRFTEITEDDLTGSPALVWPPGQRMPRITWQPNGRLLVEVEAPIDLRSQILWSCYSSDREPERPYLCSASNEIDLLVREPTTSASGPNSR